MWNQLNKAKFTEYLDLDAVKALKADLDELLAVSKEMFELNVDHIVEDISNLYT